MSTENTQVITQNNINQAQLIAQSLQLAFQQANSILQAYGIQIYIHKIKLYLKETDPIDSDCTDPQLCIDWIVRLKCVNDIICRELKESYLKMGNKI
jgi:hypothetical protein